MPRSDHTATSKRMRLETTDIAASSSAAASGVAGWKAAQQVLRERLFHTSCHAELPGLEGNARLSLEAETQKVCSAVERVVVHGESTSLLLIGPRGSGKSRVVARGLARAAALPAVGEHGGFLQATVNALVHPRDNEALREVARQLHLEIAADLGLAGGDGDGGDEDNEAAGGGGAVVPARLQGSTAEVVAALLEAIRENHSSSDAGGSGGQGQATRAKPLVLVLDEFDLFAHAGKQSLLYTLFDTAQAKAAPLVILGLTCRLDVLSLLEKRVLSRFSHQQIRLAADWTQAEYGQLFRAVLTLEPGAVPEAFVEQWEAHLADFLVEAGVRREIDTLFDTNKKDFRALQGLAAGAVLGMSAAQPWPSPVYFYENALSQSMDSKAALLLGVSVLEMTLLVVANNVTIGQDLPAINFELVFKALDEELMHQKDGLQRYSKAVAFKAFEHLIEMEFLRPVERAASSARLAPAVFRSVRLMIEPSQVLEAVQKHPILPTSIKVWGKRLLGL